MSQANRCNMLWPVSSVGAGGAGGLITRSLEYCSSRLNLVVQFQLVIEAPFMFKARLVLCNCSTTNAILSHATYAIRHDIS